MRRDRPAVYSYGFSPPADDLTTGPEIARLGRNLTAAGIAPSEQLAGVLELPTESWDELWRDLRDHVDRDVDRERAA